MTLDTYITKSHYDKAANRAPPGKTPGLDTITNELIKHLSEEVHRLIYIHTIPNHGQRELCAERVVQERHLPIVQAKKDPHNISYYRPITRMNGIIKLWTSILTSIGSTRAEAQGILSATTNGVMRYRKYLIVYLHTS